MAYTHKIDSGSMFRNDEKATDTDRDYQGSARVACPHCNNPIDFWLSGWVNDMKSRAGKYLSVAFKAKDEQPQTSGVKPQELDAPEIKPKESRKEDLTDLDDDIPF